MKDTPPHQLRDAELRAFVDALTNAALACCEVAQKLDDAGTPQGDHAVMSALKCANTINGMRAPYLDEMRNRGLR